MLTLILYAILTGALAGILPGLFGIGGGVVLVPMINFFLIHQGFPAENIMHYAVGTSLATMVFSTASASYFQIRRGFALWPYVKYIAPFMILGGIIGVGLGDYFSNIILKTAFSGFCILMAINFTFAPSSEMTSRSTLSKAHLGFGFLGLGVGICSGLAGIGGGVLLLPVLTRLGWPLKKVGGLAAICTFPTVLFAACSAMYFGSDLNYQPTMPHIGYVLWPLALIQGVVSILTAYVGVHLAHILPGKWLKRILACLLLLISGLMFPWK
tara:strand:- start:30312 stop:31118 length:807 start_codon:yes stop_codon:yes gene_type:complete